MSKVYGIDEEFSTEVLYSKSDMADYFHNMLLMVEPIEFYSIRQKARPKAPNFGDSQL
jgi:hypothetical protein